MPNPMVTFKNSTSAKVEWGHLFHLGGPLLRFDVNITHQRLGESHVIDAGMESSVEVAFDKIGHDLSWVPDCYNDSVTNLYNFSVRAVTFDPASEMVYIGDWSREEVTPAYCAGKLSVRPFLRSLRFLPYFYSTQLPKQSYEDISSFSSYTDPIERLSH